jgi:hypothetical protein
MAAGSKRGIGISIVGFVFGMFGLVLVTTGNLPIGIVMAAMGMIFIVVGVAAARKATPSNDSTGTQPPTDR